MNIEQEIQNLKAKIQLLEQELHKEYDWDNAPVICHLDGFEYRLGPQAPDELNWDAAKKWCESVGGELPDRLVLFTCYMNDDIRAEFTPESYWSSKEFSGNGAWDQYFGNSRVASNSKTKKNYVRAIRKYPI